MNACGTLVTVCRFCLGGIVVPEHITTYSGIYFYPTMPEKEKIEIIDIAHPLSLICRGNGHVHSFFSVGQHCIACAKEAIARDYSPRLVLACLLHDASEVYMSDVPRPFKKYLTEYLEFEDKMLSCVYEKFLGTDLTYQETQKVREIDDAMLYFDLKVLLKDPMDVPEPEIHITPDFTVRPFEDVEKEYLDIFSKYSKLI